jgi:hypothetical protein
MKKRLRYLNRLDEFLTMADAPTKPKPKTVPKPDTNPTPFPKPSNPPQPQIDPRPKNIDEGIKKCVERFNALYRRDKSIMVREGLEENPGFPAFGKMKSRMPRPDLRTFMQLGQESGFLMMEIMRMEQQNFTDEQLEQIAKDIVEKVIDGTAILKKGDTFKDFNFDVKFVRDLQGGDLGGDVDKAPNPEKEEEIEQERESNRELDLAINKREIINAMTQGFGLMSQARMFDQDMDEVVDTINSELLRKYFEFMSKSVESHKYMDINWFRQQMDRLQQDLERTREENRADDEEENDQDNRDTRGMGGGSGGMIVPARMHVVFENGVPVIKVEASCLILAIQEMVKGVFDVISYHSGSQFEKPDAEKILDIADNWFNEQQGFVYGPEMVKIFKDFFRSVEDKLMQDGVITEYDDTMMLSVLAGLYSPSITSDEEFIDIFSRIFNTELDEDLWPIDEVSRIYKMALESTGHGKQDSDEDEYGGYTGSYGEEEDEDEDDFMMPGKTQTTPSQEEEPTLDDLLDKISEFGRKSLTPREEELLKKYAENQSMVVNFKNFMLLQESKRKF